MSANTVDQALAVQESDGGLAIRTPMDLLNVALKNNAAIDVIERLAALQEKAEAKQSQQDYDRALMRVQSNIKAIKTDKEVKTSGGKVMYKYASYEALDAVIRPLYLQEGFNLSFTDRECQPGRVRVVCRCSHRDGHLETYEVSLAVDPGRAGLSQTDAELAAQSKAKRRILRNIFNIVDDAEDEQAFSELSERLEWILSTRDEAELQKIFSDAFKGARAVKDAKACLALVEARDKKRGEFRANH